MNGTVDVDQFEFKLNGQLIRIRGVSPQLTLLDYVRSIGLTGSKEGCAEGACGSCAVLLVKDGPHGTRYQPLNSCLVPLPSVAGQEVLTIEGLTTNGQLSPVQSAMVESGATQCGYCTPGFVISMFAEHYRRERRSADAEALGGHLCRCTGYRSIQNALLSLGSPPPGPHLARLEQPAPKLSFIRYVTHSGRFSRPRTLAECLDLIQSDPHARLVAGGTDIGVATNLNDERFVHLVAVDGLDELRTFHDKINEVEIGAALSLSELRECWTNAPSVINGWLRTFATPLIRNRATLGGNLVTASPIGDSAPLLLALDAAIVIGSQTDQRTVPLASFYTGHRRTVLEYGDIVISIRIPKPLPNVTRFYKITKRLNGDNSTVAAGISLWRDDTGIINRARIAFGGVAPTPLRAYSAEEVLVGTIGDEDDFSRVRERVATNLSPISDYRGSAEYRLALTESIILKFQTEISSGYELDESRRSPAHS